MRVLIICWPAPSHFFPLVPFASALRAAGHQVAMTTPQDTAPTMLGSGIHVIQAGLKYNPQVMSDNQLRRLDVHWAELPAAARWLAIEPLARQAESTAGVLLDRARRWRPDLILFEPSAYAGPLIASALGIPSIRHLWGVDHLMQFHDLERYALAPLAARLGASGVETLGDLVVDCCPASMQVPWDSSASVPRVQTCYVPFNGRAVVPDWLRKPPDRDRVCVTWGTTGYSRGPYAETLRRVIEGASVVDAEVVVTLSREDAEAVGPLPGNVKTLRMLALSLVLPTCRAIVAQGGLGTMMTSAYYGLPQVVVPQADDQILNCERLAATGAGRVLPFASVTAEQVTDALTEVLASPDAAAAADRLAAETRGQLMPWQVVRMAEDLAGVRKGRAAAASQPPVRRIPARRTPVRRCRRVLVAYPRWNAGAASGLIPLAWAYRLAGHEVRLAVPAEAAARARLTGLPVIQVGYPADVLAERRRVFNLPGHERATEVGTRDALTGLMSLRFTMAVPEEHNAWAATWSEAYVDMYRRSLGQSADYLDATVALARAWRPDLVLFGPDDYAGPLAAAAIGVPAIRHLDWTDRTVLTDVFEREALRPAWQRHGLSEPDVFGDLTIDPCPDALRLQPEYAVLGVRPAPFESPAGPVSYRQDRRVKGRPAQDGPAQVRPAQDARPRVAVAFSWSPAWPAASRGVLAQTLEALAALDVTVQMAGQPRDLTEASLPANVTADATSPLSAILPGCSAMVTCGTPDALLAAIMHMVPAVVLPQVTEQAARARMFARTGAGVALPPSGADPEAVRSAVASLLAGEESVRPLSQMRAELLDRPGYGDLVDVIAATVSNGS
ncbi:MAG TPA: nucleotide disphospho-sugar-binding domain-containing protein [Streptosporangiaceae bacterium]|nr:nucleotide disphospho-sugar-binding domain-containing protein [Streptosporangiaceae bacterium]